MIIKFTTKGEILYIAITHIISRTNICSVQSLRPSQNIEDQKKKQ